MPSLPQTSASVYIQRRYAEEDYDEGNGKEMGNSAAVRIPAAVMQATDLDEVVDVRAEAGRIVIEPVR
jgi:hypothetical protein